MAMIAGGRLVALPHKCGTSYVTRVLKASFPEARLVAKDRHLPMEFIPLHEFEGVRVIGLVRNPFNFYVSRWCYLKQTANCKISPFPDSLEKNIYNLQGIFGILPKGIPEPHADVGSFSWQHFMYHSRHFSEWCAHGGLCSVDVDLVLRVESLTGDLCSEFGDHVKPHLNQWRNHYQYGDYRDYYTEDLRKLVEQADRLTLELYGYLF